MKGLWVGILSESALPYDPTRYRNRNVNCCCCAVQCVPICSRSCSRAFTLPAKVNIDMGNFCIFTSVTLEALVTIWFGSWIALVPSVEPRKQRDSERNMGIRDAYRYIHTYIVCEMGRGTA